nr:uncharacterized protein LOC124214366 [Neodiprion pinetum]
MEGETTRITKLKGSENWSCWKFQTSVILRAQGSLNVVNSIEEKPPKIIATAVEDSQLLHIMNCDTAKEMWTKLHHVYEQKSDIGIHLLQQKWYKVTKESADSMATHIAEIEDLAHKIRTLDENISDSMVITKILITLPSSYSHFITAWESTSQEQRTLGILTERLLAEETRKKGSEEEENEALAAFKQWKKNDKKKKSGEQSSQKNKPGEALVMEIAALCEDDLPKEEGWYLDSGATEHMSNQKDWFVGYETLQEPIPIKIGNGERIYAVGKGNINVLAYDNNVWKAKHLAEVLHVPKLKYNLFSTGAALDKDMQLVADSKGCRCNPSGRMAE